ncbi:MAG: hypothetical protein QNJ97_09535 [Myxococcota bacterium]|nr:hypothetical protein [Myxococcota bacterium]
MAYLFIARTADTVPGDWDTPVEPDDLDELMVKNDLDGYDNVVFLDGDFQTPNGEGVWDSFINSNEDDFYYTAGIPMVFKKDMTIGIISGTYEWDSYPLSEIQDYLAE